LELGQTNTSDVMSCVRSNRNIAAETSFACADANGSLPAAPVPQTGVTSGPPAYLTRG
jgi:hypothetical protein